MPRIIARREKKEIQLIPIIARNVTLDGTGIGKYQCLPQDEFRQLKPIIEWDEREIDKVWTQIDKQIRGVIDRFNQSGKDDDSMDSSASVTLTPPAPIISPTKQDTLKALKKKLKKSVVKDLGNALDELDSLISDESSLYNMLLQQQSRHNSNKKRENLGTVSLDNIRIENARIRQSVHHVIDELTEEDLA